MKYNTSVVICTHNRKEHLLKAIRTFKKIKKSYFGLVVIDSSDKKLNNSESKGIDNYIYDGTTKPLSPKRNIAIKRVKADFIIFTDDDCIPAKNWFSEIMEPFSDYKVACVTGRTIPFGEFKKSDFEKIFTFDNLGREKMVIQRHFGLQNLWRFGHGNNMAFRASIFREVGLFDERLGVGTEGKAGEDVDMFYRIYKAGYKIVFNPNAVILHKHIAKQDLVKWAQNNTYASHSVLFKHHDFNTTLLFLAGIFKLKIDILKAIISGDNLKAKIKFYSLLGWIGLKAK